MALLEVRNLKTYYLTHRGIVKAVDGVSFEVGRTQILGLVGESGCGKTTCGLSILALLSPNARIFGGHVFFEGKDLLKLSESELRKVRGNKISMIFQGALNALDPVKRVIDQVAEVLLIHEGSQLGKSRALRRASELFRLTGLAPSSDNKYPHELSGGMKQRVMIAMALACTPDLVIADEPTTSLDIMVETQILELMNSMKKETGISVILITHNLPRVVQYCDQIAVMYAGKIVEYCNITSFLTNALHPYSKGLIKATPQIKGPLRAVYSIPGEVPNPLNIPSGCRFHPRCRYCMDICRKKEPELVEARRGHYVACHLTDKI